MRKNIVLKIFCKALNYNSSASFYVFLTFGRWKDVWWGWEKVVLLQFLFGQIVPAND
jgi:hypothetical protein